MAPPRPDPIDVILRDGINPSRPGFLAVDQ